MSTTLRLNEQDEANMNIIKEADGVKTKTKAIRLALQRYANIVKE